MAKKKLALLAAPEHAPFYQRELEAEFDIQLVTPDPDYVAGDIFDSFHTVALCEDIDNLAGQLRLAESLLDKGLDVLILRPQIPHGIEGLGLARRHLAGMPLLFLPGKPVPEKIPPAKRFFDTLFSIFILLAGLPFWLIIALAVKLLDFGPALFVQKRVGAGGREFNFLKFRTMHPLAEAKHENILREHGRDGEQFKLKNDPRLTLVGKFLRRFSLDEVLQFIHVLSGKMSVVGPRPPLPEEVAKYQPHQRTRLEGWVGVTGLWQVCGRAEIKNLDEIVLLDTLYLRNHSFVLDLRIIARTIHVVITGRGAY